MKYIALPFNDTQRLSFYLAQEEYVARFINEDDCFFMWQVEPTVIFGRNQLIENEVNLDYCRTHNVQTYRRKSGGGCVYADKSNVMFSYINFGESVSFTFDKYIRLVTHTLQQLGINAKTTGRNDICIEGRKVSGNAFYHIPHRNIVHGTMLYDTNMQNMVGSITPSNEKLVSKGVESVRQHIALLKEHTDLSLTEFMTFVRQHLCESEITLDDKAVASIREIEKEYLSSDFIYGNNPRYSITRHKRIENCGEFETRIELKNNVIKNINMMGDYFLTGDIDSLMGKLRNTTYTEQAITTALEGI
ncbi:MAG: lipoate protein ligase C-terminal domain-containing protein, partial [Bacteroidaceae bacterium]